MSNTKPTATVVTGATCSPTKKARWRRPKRQEAAAYYAPYVPLKSPKKENTMTWLKRKIHNWSRPEPEYKDVDCSPNESNGLRHYHHGISFTIHPASGGFIMEYTNSNGDAKLHVIKNLDELGEEVQKVIVIEALTQ